MQKKAAGRKKPQAKRRSRKGAFVAAFLVFPLVSVGAAFALLGPMRPSSQGTATKPARSAATSAVALQSQGNTFSPSAPTKEYIYAGGRLVATEEPVPTPTPPPPCTPPTTLIISEFRFRGVAGPNDEFIEFYNNSDSQISVCTADQSAGWALASRKADGSSASTVFVIPYGKVIPARGHLLAVNNSPNGYSLANTPNGSGTTATGDITYTTDIEDDSGVALFDTANPANFIAGNRLDAAGFSGASGSIADLYREGAGLSPIGSTNGQYTFVRKMNGPTGYPQDTGDNSSDFFFLSTDGVNVNGVQSMLGAPGPENLSSPVQRNASFSLLSLDQTVGSSLSPNRVRDPSNAGPNSTFGTLSLRKRVVNNTGVPVTRLRFRIVDMTTYPETSDVADLRALTSSAVTVTVNDAATCLAATGSSATPCAVTVQGTTVEQPPSQPDGGGDNSALSVGTVTTATPIQPGASVELQFLLGVAQTGTFHFFINIEAQP